MIRRVLLMLVLLGAVGVVGPGLSTASACPMCKAANDTDDARPRAYMYSILFMLTVPATIFTSLGVGLYRMNKAESAATTNDDETV